MPSDGTVKWRLVMLGPHTRRAVAGGHFHRTPRGFALSASNCKSGLEFESGCASRRRDIRALRKLADMRKQLLRTRLPIVIGLILAIGCSTSHTNTTASPATTASPPPASTTNGRSIFQTGKDVSGVQIVAREPPLFRSCAACHRADGSGGVHLPGGAVSADLRHAALVTNQKQPYTIALLERAISTGIDNTGASLSPVMPRWKLSKQDLQAVAHYVFTELK